jgi:hypothetical protein
MEWFHALTVDLLDSTPRLKIQDYAEVFQNIAEAAKSKPLLAIMFVKYGLIPVLEDVEIKSYEIALSVRSILEALKPCWSSVPHGHDWADFKRTAQALAEECEVQVLASTRFD